MINGILEAITAVVCCYATAFECGLKCLIMQTDNINTVSQANEETAKVLHSHDLELIKQSQTGREL